MPTFQYEAMDHTGKEVKDTIDAVHAGRSPAADPPEGLLRHQDRRAGQGLEAQGDGGGEEGGTRQEEVVHHRQDLDQAALHLHPPALDAPGRRPADPAEPQDPRGPVQAGRAQERAGRRRRGHRERRDALRGLRQAPQGVRPALLQHDQGRRGRRCPRSRSSSAWPTSRRSRRRSSGRSSRRWSTRSSSSSSPCVIVGFILYFIIPKFEAIFNDFGVDLPAMTDLPDQGQPLRRQLLLHRAR